MKPQSNLLNPQMYLYVITFVLLFLFNFNFCSVFGADGDSLKIKLIGGGQNEYRLSYNDGTGEFQQNNYSLDISCDLNLTINSENSTHIVYNIVWSNMLLSIDCKVIVDPTITHYVRNTYLNYREIKSGYLVYSIQNDSIEEIVIPDIPQGDSPNYPKKIVYKNDSVHVSYNFQSPVWDNDLVVPASASLKGIFLKIIETANTDEVKYVGYNYLESMRGQDLLGPSSEGIKKTLYFPVFKTPNGKYSFINQFKKSEGAYYYASDFLDEIYLYDTNKKQIGHMHYEYEYKYNKDHVRNAILILHNDDEINQPEGVVFPYSKKEQAKYPGWDYYDIGEYPVSMLIPPLNKFPENYSKPPLMLLHGLTGKYEYAKWKYYPIFPLPINLADPKGEDVSYWFTTPGILNRISNFDAWQMYYPSTDAVTTVEKCLEFDLSYLKSLYGKKINLVTHSYGGVVTRNYVTTESEHAKNNLNKVLFITPPFYGSLAANKAYYEIIGESVEIIDGSDNEGLCYRDAALGSEIIKEYWNKKLPSLDSDNDVYDDYFVILGATSKYYTTQLIHEEAKNHSDGVVAISSASLLDKGVGFASIYGNHDDGVHAQSNHPGMTNIQQPYLIPAIIKAYFSYENNYYDFINKISVFHEVGAIVEHDKKVLKPDNMDLLSLKTSTGENYQRSLLILELLNYPSSNPLPPSKLNVYYDYERPILSLSTLIKDELYIGEFRRRGKSNLYYFYERWWGNLNLSDGCAIDLFQGNNSIICKVPGLIVPFRKEIEIGFCQSHFISFDWNEKKFFLQNSNGNSAIKGQSIGPIQEKSSSSRAIEFHVDNQTSQAIFLLSSEQAGSDSFSKFLLQPDGEVFGGTDWLLDTLSNLYSVLVENPTPGQWQIGANDAIDSATFGYEAQVLYQSNIILYNTNEQQIDIRDGYNIKATLKLPDKIKASEITVIARITSPGGETREVDFSSSQLANDTCFHYTTPLNHDTVGVYLIEIEISGIYDGYRFERAVSSQIEVTDSSPKLLIPDIYFDGLTTYKEINLLEQVYCQECNPYNYHFSYNIINNNDIYINVDSSSIAFITSSSFDTVPSEIEFLLMENEQIVCRDTVAIYNSLPDLKTNNIQLSKTKFEAGDSINLSFDIQNITKSYSNNLGRIGVVLSIDSLYDKKDILLTHYQLQFFSPEESASYNKKLTIPGGISYKYPYLLVVADMDSTIQETDKSNNTICIPVDFTPQTNFKKMITVDAETGELDFTDPNQNYPGSISYNGYQVNSVPWWNNYYIWAYASGSTLPIWVNYRFNISNFENLDSVKVFFRARGTTYNGEFYSYLYQQTNNTIIISGDQQLINSTDWTTYGLMLDNSYLQEGFNDIKIGTSASSRTYVALNGIAVELYYLQDTSEVVTEIYYSTNNDNDILIYPNPTNDVLYIKGLDPNTDIEIYDINGRVIMMKRKSETQFDISHLRSGIFFIRATTPDGIFVKKIVKL